MDKPVSLLCETEGSPPPDITWHKDGHALTESIRQRILNSGALQIAFAQPDDAGQYTCMAANMAGSSSMSTTLTVHGRLFNTIYLHLLYQAVPFNGSHQEKMWWESKPEWMCREEHVLDFQVHTQYAATACVCTHLCER